MGYDSGLIVSFTNAISILLIAVVGAAHVTDAGSNPFVPLFKWIVSLCSNSMKGSRLDKVAPIASITLPVSHALVLALTLRSTSVNLWMSSWALSLGFSRLGSCEDYTGSPTTKRVEFDQYVSSIWIDRFIVLLWQTVINDAMNY